MAVDWTEKYCEDVGGEKEKKKAKQKEINGAVLIGNELWLCEPVCFKINPSFQANGT